jgi:hypothetical protein
MPNQLGNDIVFGALLVNGCSNFGKYILNLILEHPLGFFYVGCDFLFYHLYKLSVVDTFLHKVHYMFVTIDVVDDHAIGLLNSTKHSLAEEESDAAQVHQLS